MRGEPPLPRFGELGILAVIEESLRHRAEQQAGAYVHGATGKSGLLNSIAECRLGSDG